MSSTSKTVREWIKDLPLDIKEKYIANLDRKDELDQIRNSFERCITSAFTWSKTKEGVEFWHDVSKGHMAKKVINNTYEIY